MQFQVTQIEFDFDFNDPETFSFSDGHELTEEVIDTIWEAIDEDDLVEEITCATGWGIKSIDYRIILK